MSLPPPPSPDTAVNAAVDAAEPVVRALLEDGSLAVRAAAAVWPGVAVWMPRVPAETPAPDGVRAWIDAEAGDPAFDAPDGEPALALCGVGGWTAPGGRVLLCEPGRRVSAVVEPTAGRASVRLRPPAPMDEPFRVEMFAGLTLSAAFLLWHLGRTLVHAGAVIGPDGRAWLLVGGSFSGKTTTCLTLIRAGWDYLADDQVVLRAEEGGVRVEGWPRRFNVDHGYERGAPRGVRGRVDPEAFGPGRWRRSAQLGGLLFPRVEAALPTTLEPVSAADALTRLLQGSPWLPADPPTAAGILATLQRTAQMPAFGLRLGRDSYNNWKQLRDVVAVAAHQTAHLSRCS